MSISIESCRTETDFFLWRIMSLKYRQENYEMMLTDEGIKIAIRMSWSLSWEILR